PDGDPVVQGALEVVPERRHARPRHAQQPWPAPVLGGEQECVTRHRTRLATCVRVLKGAIPAFLGGSPASVRARRGSWLDRRRTAHGPSREPWSACAVVAPRPPDPPRT